MSYSENSSWITSSIRSECSFTKPSLEMKTFIIVVVFPFENINIDTNKISKKYLKTRDEMKGKKSSPVQFPVTIFPKEEVEEARGGGQDLLLVRRRIRSKPTRLGGDTFQQNFSIKPIRLDTFTKQEITLQTQLPWWGCL